MGVGEGVGVRVGVGFRVGVGVCVAIGIGVEVGVGAGVPVGSQIGSPKHLFSIAQGLQFLVCGSSFGRHPNNVPHVPAVAQPVHGHGVGVGFTQMVPKAHTRGGVQQGNPIPGSQESLSPPHDEAVVVHCARFDQLLGGVQPAALLSTLTSKLYAVLGDKFLT